MEIENAANHDITPPALPNTTSLTISNTFSHQRNTSATHQTSTQRSAVPPLNRDDHRFLTISPYADTTIPPTTPLSHPTTTTTSKYHTRSLTRLEQRQHEETAPSSSYPLQRIYINMGSLRIDPQRPLSHTSDITRALEQHKIDFPAGYKRTTPTLTSAHQYIDDNTYLHNLRQKLKSNIETPSKKRKVSADPIAAPTSYRAWKKSKKPLQETKKYNKTAITDYFHFVTPPTCTNSHHEIVSDIDTMNGCTFVEINIQQGIAKKIKLIMTELQAKNTDVALIIETGLTADNYRERRVIQTIARSGYRALSSPYNDNKAAHMMFLVKNNIVTKNEIMHKNGRMISFTLTTTSRDYNVLGVYQAHDTDTNTTIQKAVKNWATQHPNSTIIMGDLNELAKSTDSQSFDKNGDRIFIQKYRGKLHKNLNKLGLIDIHTYLLGDTHKHTHIQETSQGICKSRLDYFYTDSTTADLTSQYDLWYNSPILSDHVPISMTITPPCVLKHTPSRRNFNPYTTCEKKWDNYRNHTQTAFQELALSLTNDHAPHELNHTLATFNDIIIQSATLCLNTESHTTDSPYTFAIRDNIEAQEGKKRVDEAWIDWKSGRSTSKSIYHKENKKLKTIKHNIIQQTREKQWAITEKKIEKNPNEIFKMLKLVGKKANRNTDRPHAVKNSLGETTTDPEQVANSFREEWNKLYSNTTAEKPPGEWLKHVQKGDHRHILDLPINMHTLQTKLTNLKKGKSAGEDNITNELLLHLDSHGREVLLWILNKTILDGHIPDLWRGSITTMLYKKGEKTDPLNFRPIALLNCAYKVYSSIQTDRLNAWTNSFNIINENQFGFRSGRDTADAASRVFTCISNAISTNKKLHILFLDIAKAYDSVQHWALKQTLEAYGLHDRDVHLIMDMVCGYHTKLILQDGLTSAIDITTGLRQGDGLSPILYSLFLNPLLEWLSKEATQAYQIGTESFHSGAYADDMTLIARSHNGIIERMRMVDSFMTHNDIKINTTKSGYHWRGDSKADVRCKGERFDEQGDKGLFTYLGWTTNLHLDWRHQVDTLIDKYTSTTHRTLLEKGLLLDQKITIINAVANASIAYRTKLMYTMHNQWLKELDIWTLKLLNKRGNLPPQTNAAYWYTFRGLKNLFIENTAGFINHSVDRILNDTHTNDAVRAYTLRIGKDCFSRQNITIANGRTDNITHLRLDTNITRALYKADIQYISQLHNKPGSTINISQFDQLDMDAPVELKRKHVEEIDDPYNGWGRTVLKQARSWTAANSHPIITTGEPSPTRYAQIFTDGSLRDHKATYGAVVSNTGVTISGSTIGAQEINNAELQAIINALDTHTLTQYVDIYSDSLNCVNFAQKALLLSRRLINKQPNAESKLQLQALLLARKNLHLHTEFYHVRSHANDRVPDAHTRKKQNLERFGANAHHIELGNEAADTAASLHPWNNIPIKLQNCQRKYIAIHHNRIIFDKLGKNWKETQYQKITDTWKLKQPVRTEFLHHNVDPLSLPTKSEKYANLTCKVLTGTVWTEKLKKRLKLTESDQCKVCGSLEDSRHALGTCADMLNRHDLAWKEILQIGTQNDLTTKEWTPWFSTTSFRHDTHNIPQHLGDKGLTPTSFRRRIMAADTHVQRPKKNLIINKIIRYWKWAQRTHFINRYREIKAGSDVPS